MSSSQASTRYVKFRYIDNGFDASIADPADQSYTVFAGNSCYDPQTSVGGVQPYDWDAYSFAYSAYTVAASKITIYPRCATADMNIRVFIFPSWTSGAESNTDPSDLSAMKGCRQMVLTSTSAGNGRATKLSNYFTTRRAVGPGSADYSVTSSVGANPGLPWYWKVYFDNSSYSAGSTTAALFFDVKIVYYTKLINRLLNRNES